jgi:cytochrome d ubiquinol oxidase subunit II
VGLRDEGAMSTFAAVLLFAGVVAYAVLAGADFGAGFWDLTAGGAESGRAPRHLIDLALAPVWEANHVWLIFCLVMLWTGFPTAFAAIMTTLYLPLGLAALGIVARGSGFAFRKVLVRTEHQRVAGAAFAVSSVITPFFLGTVAGGIASGRVPRSGYGDPISSWVNPTSLLGGVLAVLACAVLAAVFLVAEARLHHGESLERWFRRRARLASAVTGAVVLAGILVLRADSPRLFAELTSRGLPAVLVSGVCGLAALVLLPRGDPALLRLLAVAAVVAVVVGWGVSQYPYLLGTHLTIDEAAAPAPTLWTLTLVAAAAVVLILPGFALLFMLQQRGRLETDERQ